MKEIIYMKMNREIKQSSIDQLISAMEDIFDTRDKAYMFFRLEFPNVLHRLYLECSPHERAWHIYNEFERQGMIGSLMAVINSKFNKFIILEME